MFLGYLNLFECDDKPMCLGEEFLRIQEESDDYMKVVKLEYTIGKCLRGYQSETTRGHLDF